MVKRAAFTLIELIIAIVIIGIVMLPIPTMMQTGSESLEGSLAQEAIFAVATQLAQISTYNWDGESVDVGDPIAAAKILDTTAGAAAYNRYPDNNSTLRRGGLAEDLHRSFNTNLTYPSATGGVHSVTASISNVGSGLTGYKRNYSMSTSVVYVNDTPAAPFGFGTAGSGAGSTNIKMIDVSISEGATLISRLRTYVCNIGEVDYAKRSF